MVALRLRFIEVNLNKAEAGEQYKFILPKIKCHSVLGSNTNVEEIPEVQTPEQTARESEGRNDGQALVAMHRYLGTVSKSRRGSQKMEVS